MSYTFVRVVKLVRITIYTNFWFFAIAHCCKLRWLLFYSRIWTTWWVICIFSVTSQSIHNVYLCVCIASHKERIIETLYAYCRDLEGGNLASILTVGNLKGLKILSQNASSWWINENKDVMNILYISLWKMTQRTPSSICFWCRKSSTI